MEKKPKKKRKRYTAGQRLKILAAGANEGLTGKEVQKRFGVTPVTYYSWRKSAGKGKRGRCRRMSVRSTDQARIKVPLPKVIETESGPQRRSAHWSQSSMTAR